MTFRSDVCCTTTDPASLLNLASSPFSRERLRALPFEPRLNPVKADKFRVPPPVYTGHRRLTLFLPPFFLSGHAPSPSWEKWMTFFFANPRAPQPLILAPQGKIAFPLPFQAPLPRGRVNRKPFGHLQSPPRSNNRGVPEQTAPCRYSNSPPFFPSSLLLVSLPFL